MSDGILSLKVSGESGRPTPYDVVARIEALDPAVEAVDLVLPSSAVNGVDVVLDPGFYSVQLFLPSGRVLQRGVQLDSGGNVPIEFLEPAIGPAGFSLQQASGGTSLAHILGDAVRTRSELAGTAAPVERRDAPAERGRGAGSLPRSTSRGPGRAVSKFRLAGAASEAWDRAGQATAKRFGRADAASGTDPGSDPVTRRRIARLPVREAATATLRLTPPRRFEGSESWRGLASGPSGWNQGEETRTRARADDHRLDVAIWRLASDLAGDDVDGSRRWGLVSSAKDVELVSLPAPWRRVDGGELSPVDLLVDSRLSGRAITSVAIQDPTFDGLLSYLDSGRVSALRPMVAALERSGVIERVICGEVPNPLAACATAYVGLTVHEPAQQERWDDWLATMMARFDWLPDVAIVHARRIILRPKGADGGDQAMEALERAYRAGVPYYSAGLLLMREMAEVLRADYPRAAEILEEVSPIAARCDPRRTFTVLRFPSIEA